MIKFLPKKENNNTGTPQSYLDNLDAIASDNIARQLNAKGIEKECALHPDFESTIWVTTEPSVNFEIKEVCCDEFRKELEYFLEAAK